jgi:hypothetical protein
MNSLSMSPFSLTVLASLLHFAQCVCAQQNPVMTMSFESPVQLQAGQEMMDLGSHAAPRAFDWDADGDLDLLVGDGKGRVVLFENVAGSGPAAFKSGASVRCGERDRWGAGYIGAVLSDLNGDGLVDLAVSHSGNRISIHSNEGSRARPLFAEEALEFLTQPECHGRFDIVDWDGDGLNDLLSGSFGGQLGWHRNIGTSVKPAFGASIPLEGIGSAYNSHPRLVDCNQDGLLDLLLGVNWGTFSLYLNEGDYGSPRLKKPQLLQSASDSRALNIRSQIQDDTTPELMDLDRDGVVDLLSGGKNGKVFWLRGIDGVARANAFASLITKHGPDFSSEVESDEAVRNSAFSQLHALSADLASGLLAENGRRRIYDLLVGLVEVVPGSLRMRTFDLETEPHGSMLAAQYWVALQLAAPDTKEARREIATVLGFPEGYRRLFVDLGVLFIDNKTADDAQLVAMHRLMTAIPPDVWDVQTITVADWLGDAVKTHPIRARSGINIFGMRLGVPENSFAADAPRPGITDVYLICLAHELAHNMLDTVGRQRRPELYERKFAGLSQAAGKDVIFRVPNARGLDVAATKARFLEIGSWDGEESSWREAWISYFKKGEKFDRSYTRGNVQFFLDSPQEAFATLANQFFADSQLMLEFCKVRWDAGYRSNVNQFLLIADYLSDGSSQVPFYQLVRGGKMKVFSANLKRDAERRISQVDWPGGSAKFSYGEADLAIDFELEITK